MQGVDNSTIKQVVSDVNDLIKEQGRSQVSMMITSGVAITLQALLQADTEQELPYTVTKKVREVMKQFNVANASDDFELGFMLAIGAVREAVNSTSLTTYTKRMIFEAINDKLGALQ